MPNIYDFARNLLQQNPDKANTPLGQQLLEILDSKDYSRGEALGQNICKTYNVDPKEAYNTGKKMFGL